MKGLDINIRGLTRGYHFDMISKHCKDGGNIDWDLLSSGGQQIITRKVWGATHKVVLSYCSYEKVLIAECE